jgi:hypothetical protein
MKIQSSGTSWTLKTVVVSSSRKLVALYRFTWLLIPENFSYEVGTVYNAVSSLLQGIAMRSVDGLKYEKKEDSTVLIPKMFIIHELHFFLSSLYLSKV